MRVQKLHIKNIGMIADEAIELNQPLILFYGEIRQGKSTILNAVRWVFGGEFPADIIRHGQTEASIELTFTEGYVKRSWYVPKGGGETKARPIQYVKGGKPVETPSFELRKLLNPFLLDQDFLRNKGEAERKRFFLELFGLDTAELDREYLETGKQAEEVRITLKTFGDIDTSEQPIDEQALAVERAQVIKAHEQKMADVRAELETFDAEQEKQRARAEEEYKKYSERRRKRTETEREIARLKEEVAQLEKWMKANQPLPLPEPFNKDAAKRKALMDRLGEQPAGVDELSKRIAQATITNSRIYQNKERAEKKAAQERHLVALEARRREIRGQKAAKLQEISNKSQIQGLAFDGDGELIFEETTMGMLSTSQIMRLSEQLSSMYPKDLGINLIDRAESLGTSIFEFVDRAKREEKTILATIVGERPATVPDGIGVFVVKDGRVNR